MMPIDMQDNGLKSIADNFRGAAEIMKLIEA
jgi:hypothetical protein